STRRKANDASRYSDDRGGQQGKGAEREAVLDVQGGDRRRRQLLRVAVPEFEGCEFAPSDGRGPTARRERVARQLRARRTGIYGLRRRTIVLVYGGLLVCRDVRDPGRDRRGLGAPHGWWGGRAVWLAQGSLGRVLAGCPHGSGADDERPEIGKPGQSHGGLAQDAQARPRNTRAGVPERRLACRRRSSRPAAESASTGPSLAPRLRTFGRSGRRKRASSPGGAQPDSG